MPDMESRADAGYSDAPSVHLAPTRVLQPFTTCFKKKTRAGLTLEKDVFLHSFIRMAARASQRLLQSPTL